MLSSNRGMTIRATPTIEATRSFLLRALKKSHALLWLFFLAWQHAALAAQPLPYQEGELLIRVRNPNPQAAHSLQQHFHHEVKRRFDHLGWQHVTLPKGLSVAAALKRYAQHQDVLEVEPNYTVKGVGMICDSKTIPNDPSVPSQWALQRIGATAAWDVTTGSEDVVIAVIDSGVNYNHEDLAANMWRNPREIPGNGIDDDGNGYVDDVYGIDVVSGDGDPKDGMWSLYYHGSYCAGVIGAVGNNQRGVAGINWKVKIMALRFLPQSGQGVTSAMFAEISNYLLDQKARGVNIRATSNSWGYDTNNPGEVVRQSLQALGDAGILNCFAAGLKLSGGTRGVDLDAECATAPIYPQCWHLPGMITVAASDTNDFLAATVSNWGRNTVDIAAPGVGIITTDGLTTTSYANFAAGTSAACPHVAGAIALIASAYPSASAAQIKTALLASAETVGDLGSKLVSGGRLNVSGALHHPILSVAAPPHITRHPQPEIRGEADCASFCVTATGNDLHYQWLKDDAPLSGMEGLREVLQPDLNLCDLRASDAGIYSVVVSNGFGSVTSQVATLKVVDCPLFLTQPQSQQGLDGTNLLLSAQTAGKLPMSYRWERDGAEVTSDEAPSSTLRVSNTVPAHSGNYRLILSNACGMATSEIAQVTIWGRPLFVQQGQSQTVTQGSTVSLRLDITPLATLPVGVLWRQNSQNRSRGFATAFSVETNIVNIQPASAGTWIARLTNAATAFSGQSLNSSNIYLTVVTPPASAVVCAGDKVNFSASAAGTSLSYLWRYNGKVLSEGGRFQGTTSPTLAISGAQTDDTGVYSFVVINALGEPTEFRATLDVLPISTQLSARLIRCDAGGNSAPGCVEITWPAQPPRCVEWASQLSEATEWQPATQTVIRPCSRSVVLPLSQRAMFFRLGNCPP